MCGIAGLWDPRGLEELTGIEYTSQRMAGAIAHRGPDDEGTYLHAESRLSLSFRRLAILDLTDAGHQPMMSVCQRYVLVFNGEIYNHQVLRAGLRGHVKFRGHSDTEVILGGFTRWGISSTVERLNGMFAFAVFDRETRSLTLGRDRMGEKPLYYSQVGGQFLFASELKALRVVEGFKPSLNRDALALFMRHGYIPAPYTVYEDVHKLLPGCLLRVDSGVAGDQTPYWSAFQAAENSMASVRRESEAELEEELHSLLYDAVGLRMEADVPLGAFLSGGIDSSLVVSLMQAQSASSVKTFSIGFVESDHNEAVFAGQVASHLGTDHTELYISPSDALAVVPKLPRIYDEPFADSSQIPTFLVSQLARKDVAVSLSGDGGDELFGGYNRYELFNESWRKLSKVPGPLRGFASTALEKVPARHWDRVFEWVGPVLPRRAQVAHPGEKLHKLASVMKLDSPDDIYLQLVSQWMRPTDLVLGAQEPPTPLTAGRRLAGASPALQAMQWDAVTYLPDDILVKVDRAAMAVSLETRVPLLDHRVYEFAWSLPDGLRTRPGTGKYLLRKVLERYVPPSLFDRPKMGFGVPIGTWMKGPLRPWCEDLLAPAALSAQGLLDVDIVRAAWQDHTSGHSDNAYRLWCILMLQSWLIEQQR